MNNTVFIITGFLVLGFITFAISQDYIIYLLVKRHWDKCISTVSRVDSQQIARTCEEGVEINQTWKVYVTYTYNNVTYKNIRLGMDIPTLKEGNNIVLYVNPNNPTEFQIERNIKDILFPLLIVISLFVILVLVVIYQ